MQLQENTTFDSRYQLAQLLGRGGFSEVWLATDSYTKLQIALKIYAPGQGMDNDGLKVFSSELAGVFNLNHTNLLKPTHVDTWEGMPYLIMPFCSFGSLAKKAGKMPEQNVWRVIHDVAAGLQYLHQNNIVHQDIKPDNILLDSIGNYVITDFGISTKARSALRKSVIANTTAGGTMAYMGPERFSKQPAPTKASDIWSLGATIYELLTGDVPFSEMGGGLQKSGADIPEIIVDVSQILKDTITQMLALETWDRPQAEKLVEIATPFCIGVPTGPITSQDADIVDIGGRETIGFQQGPIPSPISSALSVAPDKITLLAEGGQTKQNKIKIHSIGDWKASIDKQSNKWLHITKKQGSEDSVCVWGNENRSGKTRNGYIQIISGSEQKSIQITQPSLSKSKAWKWVIIISLIIVIVVILVILLYSLQIKEKKKEIFHIHNQEILSFENYLQKANIDQIDYLDSAYNSLSNVKTIESSHSQYFVKEQFQYQKKRNKLLSKVNTLYQEAERKYNKAPAGTNTQQRNLEKRKRIKKIKTKIESKNIWSHSDVGFIY